MDLEKKLGKKGKTVKLDEKTSIMITNENVNRLLKRIELDLYIDHVFSGTPSKSLLKNVIANLYNVPEENVIVKNIESRYGLGTSIAHIHVYSDTDYMKRVELKHILRRNNVQI
ncbi:MAG: 30S ribosomal protein S24e [Ignisphaera sp.]|uniref:Small ribosomal subunit protein eS24 n=1 Tax=Ignisphaera aggregans TaxID=334771 RepID=A0A7J3MZX0_9CREN